MPEPIIEPTPTPEPTSVVNADGSFTEDWYKSYDEADHPTLSRYKNLPDLVKTTLSAKSKFGKDPESLVEIPSEHSSDEVKAAFRKARGAPDNIDAYEYTLADDMAVKLGPLQDDRMAKLKDHAHKHGWSPAEFKDNLDFYHSMTSEEIDTLGQTTEEQRTADAAAAKAELRKKPGWQSEEEFNTKVQIAQSVMEKYELVESVADLNLQNNPKFISGLNKIADSMSEDTLKGLKGSSAVTKDTLKRQVAENRAKMDEIMKKDPVNYRGDVTFRELDKRNLALYKEFPA